MYGYATDSYRSPLWLFASHNGAAVLVHRNRGTKIDFARALADKRILVIDGILFFNTHRREPLLLSARVQLD